MLTVYYSLPPIRLCLDTIDSCTPVDGAEVYNLTYSGSHTPRRLAVWCRMTASSSSATSLGEVPRRTAPPRPGAVLHQRPAGTVTAAGFQIYPSEFIELRLALDCSQRVMLQDLVVSAWYMEDDPDRMEWLRTNLILASDYLFDFTEGRMALGTVLVRQNYAGWATADLKLHTSNTLRPNANIGGIVSVETPDIAPTIPISYTPGNVYMGSYWNRFGTPPGQVNTYKGVIVPPCAGRGLGYRPGPRIRSLSPLPVRHLPRCKWA